MGVVVTYFQIPTLFSIAWKVTFVMFLSGWRYFGPMHTGKPLVKIGVVKLKMYEVIKHQTLSNFGMMQARSEISRSELEFSFDWA
jgi:hypothetical protein